MVRERAADPGALRLRLPRELLPSDGRFGVGPSKVRDAQVSAVAEGGRSILGTSHRRAPVKALVSQVREGLSALLGLPPGYEVVLGNGGAAAFWEVAACNLVRERAAHVVRGAFSQMFAGVTAAAPFLRPPAAVPHAAALAGVGDADVVAWAHNETSNGVVSQVVRPPVPALVVVDGTSAAGAVPFDAAEVDAYYFAPQKGFGSDGGLWIAALAPAAVERVEEVAATGRWIPAFLSLRIAIDRARRDETYNTPAVATLLMLADQIAWLLERGGVEWAAARTTESSGRLYAWAEASSFARPFVHDPEMRSPVVVTVDFADGVDAATIAAVLRANGVVDVEPFREVRRNQLRVGTYPAVEPDDVTALTACIDWIAERLG